jgi:hypothetical protein
MKLTTAYAFVWISISVAVSIAVLITKTAEPLWAFVIPALLSFSIDDERKSK